MSQAEIAGGQLTPVNELPVKGRRLRDFGLVSALGRQVHISDYRGRSNLVLIFADESDATGELLSELAQNYEQFRNEEAEIIAVRQCPPQECARLKTRLKLPYVVLADEDGRVHREVGASGRDGGAAAVYITDRYGEVFAAYRTRDGETLPTAAEILQWLEFINSQCPECEPPEWPA